MSWIWRVTPAHRHLGRRNVSPMHPLVELVAVSEHEWLVADEDDEVIGVVEEHSGDFEAVIAAEPWHPHFDSLDAATDYFSEYASALHLGTD